MIHYPHPIIGPTDAGDRDRPVVAPRARTRTPDARLHKTYMKPNAECTHGQYSFLFDQLQDGPRPLQDRQLYGHVYGAIALNRAYRLRYGSTFAGLAAEKDETSILR